jgi:hypothetical protein
MVGKMASSMDACSKPVCLISRKKRSQDLSISIDLLHESATESSIVVKGGCLG